jgi:hypothetical protein
MTVLTPIPCPTPRPREAHVACSGLIDMRAQAEVPSARRADTPKQGRASGLTTRPGFPMRRSTSLLARPTRSALGLQGHACVGCKPVDQPPATTTPSCRPSATHPTNSFSEKSLSHSSLPGLRHAVVRCRDPGRSAGGLRWGAGGCDRRMRRRMRVLRWALEIAESPCFPGSA